MCSFPHRGFASLAVTERLTTIARLQSFFQCQCQADFVILQCHICSQCQAEFALLYVQHCLCNTLCVTLYAVGLQGTTPSPYEAAAQAKKKRPNEDADGAQDWRWQVNKRPKVMMI